MSSDELMLNVGSRVIEPVNTAHDPVVMFDNELVWFGDVKVWYDILARVCR